MSLSNAVKSASYPAASLPFFRPSERAGVSLTARTASASGTPASTHVFTSKSAVAMLPAKPLLSASFATPSSTT